MVILNKLVVVVSLTQCCLLVYSGGYADPFKRS